MAGVAFVTRLAAMNASRRLIIPFAVMMCATVLHAQTTSPTAADLYGQAFKLLQSNQMSKVDLDTVQLGPEVAQFLEDNHQIMDLLRDAAHKPAADWPQPFDPALMSSLNVVRTAARFALLQARVDLGQNQPQQAVSDVMVAIAIGRHVGEYHVLVTSLVDIGIEITAIDQLSQELPRIPNDVLETLPASLEALPTQTTFADILNGESALSGRLAVKQGIPPALEADVVKFYAALVPSADLAPADFSAAVDVQVAQFAANPLIKTLAPSFKRSRTPVALAQAKLAMLQTAIQIMLSDPATVKQSKDPFGAGPFVYTPNADGAGGFNLTSKLPTTLHVAGP
jgi:hypothetical protein